jgi:putative peptidoglycan lipid II flippase
MSAMVLLLFVPLSCLVLVSAPYIIHLIYMRGAFSEDSVVITSRALKGMAVGMWAVCLAYVLQKVYNSRIRNREVLRAGAAGILSNALFNIIAYKYLGVMAIGLGFSLGGIVMVWFYMRGMGGLKRTAQTARICLLSVAPYGIIAFLIDNVRQWTPPTGLMVQMSWTVIFWGVIFWFFPPARDILQDLMRKVFSLREKR